MSNLGKAQDDYGKREERSEIVFKWCLFLLGCVVGYLVTVLFVV